MTALYADPSLDGPDLHVLDQTVDPATGYAADLGTIGTGVPSSWGLAQWTQRAVITPAAIAGSTTVARDPIYGSSLHDFRMQDGSEGFSVFRNAAGGYVYDLSELTTPASSAGERDLFLQTGQPFVSPDANFASPISIAMDAKLVRADARYGSTANKSDPAIAVAQVFWGAIVLFEGPGTAYQLFLQGGISDSRFGTQPVPYASSSYDPAHDRETATVNSTASGSAPLDYFATQGAPERLSFSLTGALEAAIQTLALGATNAAVYDPTHWKLDGFYVGIASQTGGAGAAVLDTELQVSNIAVTADGSSVVTADQMRAGSQITPSVAAPPPPDPFGYRDTSSGLSGTVAGLALAANPYGLASQYIYAGGDNVAITALTDNVFLQGGGGQSVLAAQGGTDVLVAGSAASWLAGAAGHDTFIADIRPGQSEWVGIAGFHAGEWALANDFLPGSQSWSWSDVSTYVGRPMMELRVTGAGGTALSLDFDGLTPADLGSLAVQTVGGYGATSLEVVHY